MITKSERNGVKGVYLDSPVCPLFFPDTEQGKADLMKQIDTEIRIAFIGLGVMALGSVAIALLHL